MTLGERICQYRVQSRLSQQEVAEKLEVSRQSVSKWETDGAVPELDKLVKLCGLFGVGLDELVQGERPGPERTGDGQSVPPVIQGIQVIRERPSPWIMVGVALLILGLLATFLGDAAMRGWWGSYSVYVGLPLTACGLICLTGSRSVPLLCGWSVFAVVGLGLYYHYGEVLWTFWRWIGLMGILNDPNNREPRFVVFNQVYLGLGIAQAVLFLILAAASACSIAKALRKKKSK